MNFQQPAFPTLVKSCNKNFVRRMTFIKALFEDTFSSKLILTG